MQACLCSRQRSPSFAGQSYGQVAQQLSAKTCDLDAEPAACKTLAIKADRIPTNCTVPGQPKLDKRSAGSPTYAS